MGQYDTSPMAIPKARTKTPKRKEDVLDALQVMVPDARITRTKSHVAEVYFEDTNSKFLITVHKPRGPKAKVAGAAAEAANRKTRAKRATGRHARH